MKCKRKLFGRTCRSVWSEGERQILGLTRQVLPQLWEAVQSRLVMDRH